MIVFKGNDRFAYRDPACVLFGDTYCLFFTVSEKQDGYLYNRIGMSKSKDLVSWTEPVLITVKDLDLNYCSPGNIIKREDDYIICFTSYPMPFKYSVRDHADETARLFTMSTKDFESFTEPVMLLTKGDTPARDLGRMIDPYMIEKDEEYFLFYKQNGVSLSKSRDLENWEYIGHTDGGENACVIKHDGKYLLIHSPENGIGFKCSDDLEHWTDCGHTTLGQDIKAMPQSRLTAGFAMEADMGSPHKYIMFYHISQNRDPETHGDASLCVAFTDDFETYYYDI